MLEESPDREFETISRLFPQKLRDYLHTYSPWLCEARRRAMDEGSLFPRQKDLAGQRTNVFVSRLMLLYLPIWMKFRTAGDQKNGGDNRSKEDLLLGR